MPRKLCPVSARICVRPDAATGSSPAMTSGPSAALEEHDRLDEIRLEAAVVNRVLDERAEGLGALGGREDAAGALRVERHD